MGLFDGILSKSWEDSLIEKAKKLGASEGGRGRPSPDSESPDAIETSFQADAAKLLIKANNKVSSKIRDWQPKLEKCAQDLNTIEVKFANRPTLESVKNDALTAFHEREHRLNAALYDSLNTEGSYKEFQVRHNIPHPPNHPEDPVDKLAVILLLVIVEGVLNSFYWKGTGDFAWDVGIAYAVGAAIVTIAIGLASGLGFRWINRSETWAKPLGISSLILGIFLIFTVSAWVSTQRGTGTIKGTFVDIPLIFGSYDNTLLFFIGIIFGSFAIIKGYKDIFGTVPGYKEMSEHYMSATGLKDKCLQEIRKEVQKPFDSAIGIYSTINFLIRDCSQRISEIKSEAKQVDQDFHLTKNGVQAVFKVVIGTYRGTNAAVRPTGIGVPSYFAQEVLLDGEINEAIYTIKRETESLEQCLKALSDSIQDQISQENAIFLEEKGRLLNEDLGVLIEMTKSAARSEFLSHIANARPSI